jgi:uncharacterized membrane protein
MRRFTIYFLPAVAVAAAVFGAFYGWVGFLSLRRGEIGVGIFLVVFGIGGISLAAALWNTWRGIVRRARDGAKGAGG